MAAGVYVVSRTAATHVGGIDSRRAANSLGDDRRSQIIGPRGAQRAGARFADRGANSGNDNSVFHNHGSG